MFRVVLRSMPSQSTKYVDAFLNPKIAASSPNREDSYERDIRLYEHRVLVLGSQARRGPE